MATRAPVPEPEEDDDRDDSVIGRAFWRSLAAIVAVAVVGGATAWWAGRKPPPPPTREATLELPKGRARAAVEMPAIPFTDVTDAAGIDFVHENGAAGEKLLPETMGGGCAFFDADGDGDQDLFLVQGARWPWDERPAPEPTPTSKLYENDGTGKFRDATAGSGLDVPFYGTGVAAGDYDGDGRVDLYVTAVGPGRLFRNAGGLAFTDVTAESGIGGEAGDWGTSCGWFDADRDGDLDLFVCHYVAWSRDVDRSQDFRLVGGGRAYGRPQNFGGTFPRLLRNDGGRFTDVSAEAGIRVTNAATGVPVGKSLGLAFDDLDGDGMLDVVVANDTVQNFLFRATGPCTFEESGNLAGIAYDVEGRARGAMGIDIARFRNDDEIGIVIGNFANEMNALYVSQGTQMQFKDDAVSNGLGPETRQELSFGVLFEDVDLDGRLDIVAANGHLEEDINKVQKTQFYRQPPELFWNCGPSEATEFRPVPEALVGKDFHEPLVGRSVAAADIDGDGDVDLLITASGSKPRLLRNDQASGHHWLRVKLAGPEGNRDGIGALVTLKGAGVTATRRVSPTRGYQSQCELPVTFGLGDSAGPVDVSVVWPDGLTVKYAGMSVDTTTDLRHPATLAPVAP